MIPSPSSPTLVVLFRRLVSGHEFPSESRFFSSSSLVFPIHRSPLSRLFSLDRVMPLLSINMGIGRSRTLFKADTYICLILSAFNRYWLGISLVGFSAISAFAIRGRRSYKTAQVFPENDASLINVSSTFTCIA